ncbi:MULTISPECIES: TetR/AcrR family transcriptional regulator [Nocardia]|uniref:TetR/AcrR family transcriptional regulator n=1 Tax=Nocardia TaxID=1817 RepID=UPI001300B560|nr:MULTISPECIES: TetR/AcrR family transcriptional regulator [Nocardia]
MRSPGRVNRGPAAAAENRAAILTAARAVFSQHGPAAPMSLISTTANVSPGVLYRHFPNRDSLTRAVFEEDIRALEQVAYRKDSSLRELLARFLDQLVECTAFVATLRPDDSDPVHASFALTVSELLTDKLAADTSGTFRPGTSARQLMLAIGLVAALLTKTPEPMRRAVADEAWELLMDGLRDPVDDR